MRHDAHCGFGAISAREIDKSGIQGVIDAIKRRVGDTKVYITVDIDVLDPAFAPGTLTLTRLPYSPSSCVTLGGRNPDKRNCSHRNP
jgi:agmatinase